MAGVNTSVLSMLGQAQGLKGQPGQAGPNTASVELDSIGDKVEFLQHLTQQLGLNLSQDEIEGMLSGQAIEAQYDIPVEALQDQANPFDLIGYFKMLNEEGAQLPQFRQLTPDQASLELIRNTVLQRLQLSPEQISQAQETINQAKLDTSSLLQQLLPTDMADVKDHMLEEGKLVGDRLATMLETMNLTPGQQNQSNQAINNALAQLNQIQTLNMPKHQTAVDVHLNSQEWSEAFNSRILVLANQRIQTASIQLDPPELGPLDVRIQMNNDKANVIFTSQHGVVREAVEQALPRLREMLQESGLQLADVDVSDQSKDQQSQDRLAGGTADHGQQYTAQTQHDGDDESEQQSSHDSVAERIALGIVDYYA